MDLANLGGGAGDPFATDALGAALDEAAEKKKKKKKKETDESAELTKKEDLVHIRVQQRNGRKCITTVQGLNQDLDLKKILKALKKQECCNGSTRLGRELEPARARRNKKIGGRHAAELQRQQQQRAAAASRALFIYSSALTRTLLSRSLAAVVEDEEMGQVLQFQGDQRDAVGKFLTDMGTPPPLSPQAEEEASLHCVWCRIC